MSLLTALIPAHNEAELIAHMLENLKQATPPPDQIIVVADGCTDTTAQVATACGAEVFQCHELNKGKALQKIFHSSTFSGIVVIFDADSTVSRHFFTEVRHAFAEGAQVVQAFVQPIGDANPVASLAAYSEVLSQVIDDAVRVKLGWSVPLRGTGMAFRADLWREILFCTVTEDIELTLQLVSRGHKIKFLPTAIVYDPKPASSNLVSRQRARWLQGQAQVWKYYWRVILKLIMRGPQMWWLVSALLLKPKTIFVLAKFVLFGLSLFLPVWTIFKIFLALGCAAEVFYYVLGLVCVPQSERERYAYALWRAPLYLGVWLRSLWLAWRERGTWLSGRH